MAWKWRGAGDSRLSAAIENPNRVPDLEDDWRRLAEQRGNAFVTPDWGSAWRTHYPQDTQLVVSVREVDGSLAGVLSLAVSGRTLHFAGSNVGDHFHPACAPGRDAEVAAAAAAALARDGPSWSTFILDNVDAGVAWTDALKRAWPARLASVPVRSTTLPYIDIGDQTWDSWRATRSRNFRSQIGRRTRALERDHAARFRRTEDPGQLAADMRTFFALHDARWDQRGGSTSQSKQVRAFHSTFAAIALERDWLRLWFLEADGRDVAAWYGWRMGDSYAYYLAGFDPAWATAGVGLVLLAHTIREAIEEGARTYDMLLGDEQYKSRFASDERQVETLLVTRALHPARFLASAEAGARRVEARLPDTARSRMRTVARTALTRLPSNRSR